MGLVHPFVLFNDFLLHLSHAPYTSSGPSFFEGSRLSLYFPFPRLFVLPVNIV